MEKMNLEEWMEFKVYLQEKGFTEKQIMDYKKKNVVITDPINEVRAKPIERKLTVIVIDKENKKTNKLKRRRFIK